MKQPHEYANSEILRQKAEELLKNRDPGTVSDLSLSDSKELIHELEVSQLMLEMQEQQLQQSEQRYRALVEWAPYAALVHRDMKIIYVNPAAVKLFGANSEHDLIGTPVLRWHHPDYHVIVRERIRRATEEGIAAPLIESKYFKVDGSVMDLEVQGIPVIYDGLPSILATFNDVTERRSVERKLEGHIKELKAFYFLNQLSERQELSMTGLY